MEKYIETIIFKYEALCYMYGISFNEIKLFMNKSEKEINKMIEEKKNNGLTFLSWEMKPLIERYEAEKLKPQPVKKPIRVSNKPIIPFNLLIQKAKKK